MIEHKCNKCGKIFKQKSHYECHINRKYPCQNDQKKSANQQNAANNQQNAANNQQNAANNQQNAANNQ